MDGSESNRPRIRYRMSTMMLLILMAALCLLVFRQTVELNRTRVLAEVALAEAAQARQALQQAASRLQPIGPAPSPAVSVPSSYSNEAPKRPK
jgi:hypothetical protein